MTFDDAAGGHLMLLDAVTGDVRWDTQLDFSAYDVAGPLTDDVGLIWITERVPEYVDLDTGDRATAGGGYVVEESSKVIGPQLARFDGDSLQVGWDPFDETAATSTIELPSPASDVTASADGSLIVATVGSEIIGIIDGEEVWRWTPDVSSIDDVTVFDEGYIGVEVFAGNSLDNWTQFARVGEEGVEPFEPIPNAFMFSEVWLPGDGDAALVGHIDESPDGRDSVEPLAVATIELREGTPIHQIPNSTNGLAGAFGDYVFAVTRDGRIDIYTGVELDPVTSIPYPADSELADLHHGIVVYDQQQSTIYGYG